MYIYIAWLIIPEKCFHPESTWIFHCWKVLVYFQCSQVYKSMEKVENLCFAVCQTTSSQHTMVRPVKSPKKCLDTTYLWPIRKRKRLFFLTAQRHGYLTPIGSARNAHCASYHNATVQPTTFKITHSSLYISGAPCTWCWLQFLQW